MGVWPHREPEQGRDVSLVSGDGPREVVHLFRYVLAMQGEAFTAEKQWSRQKDQPGGDKGEGWVEALPGTL